jgi:hypothetical protein
MQQNVQTLFFHRKIKFSAQIVINFFISQLALHLKS